MIYAIVFAVGIVWTVVSIAISRDELRARSWSAGILSGGCILCIGIFGLLGGIK